MKIDETVCVTLCVILNECVCSCCVRMCVVCVLCVCPAVPFSDHECKMKSVSLQGLLNIRRLKESIVLFIELSTKPVQQREGD